MEIQTQDKIFFIVLAKNGKHLKEKIREIEELGFPFLIVCGEQIEQPNVIYRTPVGKYDAINYGLEFIPEGTNIIVFNDVDTKIYNFEAALKSLKNKGADLVFTKVRVKDGPQILFYRFLDPIRRWVPITASGELMLIKENVLKKIKSIERCKAEDSYILFKVLEYGYKAFFCEKAYVETERTKNPEGEEEYKRRTVGGLYQALLYTKPPLNVRIFYLLLPFISVILLLTGKSGYHWMRGILLGFVDFLRGDRKGSW